MNKARWIGISGFRAMVELLELDFTADNRSMAIFGETQSERVRWQTPSSGFIMAVSIISGERTATKNRFATPSSQKTSRPLSK